MNILNYLYTQDTDLDEVLENNNSQTVSGREPIESQSEFLANAMTFAKDVVDFQFDAINNDLQTVH